MPLARAVLILLVLLLSSMPAMAQPNSLERLSNPWKGDLDELIKKGRPIRVLVSYNRTNFFLVDGARRGLEYELMEAYGKHLRQENPGKRILIAYVAVPFEELIPSLLAGKGDIIAAGLTVTKKRKEQIDFSAPYRKGVTEIIVGSQMAPPIRSIADLAGKTVHVMAGSSYAPHLKRISDNLRSRDMKPIRIMDADPYLVTEELLEMAERGYISYTAAEDHLADIWKTALPNIKLYKAAPIHTRGNLAWGVRPGNTEFNRSLSRFAATVRQGTLLGNMVFNRYYKNSDWVKHPNNQQDMERLLELRELFMKYGKKYNIDWLKLAALAYQESRLDMNQRSHAGAVGIMQVRPSTALGKNVNVKDYETLEGNIHAGTKYLRHLMDTYFQDVPEENRIDFALAAYNAGPNRVKRLRDKAKRMQLDPNQWFDNVEWAAYRDIGAETPTYVANVQMYYATYKSIYRVYKRKNI
ncbi:Peptidoglycan lytic exotransglycosylase [Pseudodesulfovibrio profundus]|uniref:Peptidoglycan lytic exotransglycosylase n=1 Tax=Pseudodesulfovibrio profundus TaxID=57320 RepID=A0A2C8F815_9BACT|nr:lytic transglycosylase F [Pseudodesulfovibrio profundus]SOB58661.1 Peptidoglycan lytic exotransglycosylase [Pseudodesulfovibrio profundus]